MKNKFEKGILTNGGFYLGEKINTNFHSHFAYIFIFSNDKQTKIITKNKTYSCPVLINKNLTKKIISPPNSKQLFIYIDPFSKYGLYLTQLFSKKEILKLDEYNFLNQNLILEKEINIFLENFFDTSKWKTKKWITESLV